MPCRKRSDILALSLAGLSITIPAFSQESKEIHITAHEFVFKPSKAQVPPGKVKLVVTNRGKFPHALAVEGRKEKISYIEPGESKSLTVIFDKAEEVISYCSQPGHRKKGMEGKLSVKGG